MRRVLPLLLAPALLGCFVDDPLAPHVVSTPDDPPYAPPAPTCAAPSLDDPQAFPACNRGGGIFFLAALVGEVLDVYTDQAAFFGARGPASPAAVKDRAAGQGVETGPKGEARSGLGQPRMFALRSDLALAPDEKRSLRFAYGCAPMGSPFAIDPALRAPATDVRAAAAAGLAPHLLYFAAERDPVPSPTGATLTAGGQVWPAIGALLTWGYAKSTSRA